MRLSAGPRGHTRSGPWAALAALLVAGCGGGGGSSAPSDALGPTGDATGEDPGDGVVFIDLGGGASGGPGTAEDAGAGGSDTAAPGTFGAACTRGSDCDSGYCVATAAGYTCTEGCVESCRPGYACVGAPSPEGDVAFVCLERPALLCQPCTRDADCNIGAAVGHRCLDYGAEGRFCGMACRGDGACPEGYACDGAEGTGLGQCRLTSGVCACNALGAMLGRATICSATNAFGTCPGTRACAGDELTACETAGAAVETCNGRDDDCDGAVDEDLGAEPCAPGEGATACGGMAYCQGGVRVCVGRSPSAEVCNGLDDDCDGARDEGFSDGDGDGTADCADDDMDDDSWPNAVDCGPTDATRSPGAVERCNGVDDDCNFLADEAGAAGCTPYLRDADGDGFGAVGSEARCLCGPDTVSGFTADQGRGADCDDLTRGAYPGAAEVCDGVDNDCDGDRDEGVQSPCGGCAPVCLFNAGERGETPLDPTEAEAGGLTQAPGGGVTLPPSQAPIQMPSIWVANSRENTVSRLDTRTGREVGRYAVCVDPSRTAVDLFGDGLITCRGDGRVAKIAIQESACIDRNRNGVIDTSRDTSNDGVIQPGEQRANDECVIWNVQPDGASSGCSGVSGCARAAGVDRDNHVWVGFWNSTRLVQLDGETGATLRTVPLTGRPYGLAIDADGIIWVASRSPYVVLKVHPVSGQVASYDPGRGLYGIAIDHLGKVWVATGEFRGASRLDPENGTWTHFGPWDELPSGRGHTRGVAVRIDRNAQGDVTGSRVFIAHHQFNESCVTSLDSKLDRLVTVIDAGTRRELPVLELGVARGPVGVGVDIDGKLWTVNQCDSTVTRLDPDTRAVLGTWPVGRNPYTYSDMTGYALRTITTQTGHYRQTFEGWPSGVTRWSALFVDAELPGAGATWLRLRYRTAETLAGLQQAAWSSSLGPFPPATLPADIDATGRHLQVEVTLGTSEGGLAPILRGVSAIADQP
jgi:DNA-binding beta-propeller fold protein YncE